MNCGNCGAQLPTSLGARYCPSCGAPTSDGRETVTISPRPGGWDPPAPGYPDVTQTVAVPGDPAYLPPRDPPRRPWHRNRRLWVAAAAVIVLAAGAGIGYAVVSSSGSQNQRLAQGRVLSCSPDPDLPAGTNVVAADLAHDGDNLVITLSFDGPVVSPPENPQNGDTELQFDLDLDGTGTGGHPYIIRTSALTGGWKLLLARSSSVGYLDSTGVLSGKVSGDRVEITLNQAKGAPALGQVTTVTTQTLVSRFQATSQTLGYVELGAKTCRSSSSSGGSTDPVGGAATGPVTADPSTLSAGGAPAGQAGTPAATPTLPAAPLTTPEASAPAAQVPGAIDLPGPLGPMFAAATPVAPEPFEGAHPNVYFMTPSHNIGCYIFIDGTPGADCTIADYNFPEPGHNCPQGAEVVMQDGGDAPSIDCASQPPLPDASKILQYGQSVQNGNMACTVGEDSLSCADVTSGIGFTLSRQQYLPAN